MKKTIFTLTPLPNTYAFCDGCNFHQPEDYKTYTLEDLHNRVFNHVESTGHKVTIKRTETTEYSLKETQ